MAFVMQKKFVISKDNLAKSLEKAVKEFLRQETLNGIAVCGCERNWSVSVSVNLFPSIGVEVGRDEATRCWCAIPVSRMQAVENFEECVAEYAREVINLVQRLNRE
jgi:hypothetical protein